MPAFASRDWWLDVVAHPLLVRDLRAAFRSSRFQWAHVLSALAVGAVVTMFLAANGQRPAAEAAWIGSGCFSIFVVCQAGLLLLLLPAWGASGIATERQRNCLDLLRTTTMSPAGMVWGKFTSTMAYAGLFLASSLPLTSVCFLYGGVAVSELAVATGVLVALAATVTSASVYLSATLPTAQRAIPAAYVGVLALEGGAVLPFMAAVGVTLAQGGSPLDLLARGLTAVSAHGRDLLGLTLGWLVLAWTAFFLLCAANALRDPSENRATALRMFYLLFVVTGTGLALAVVEESWTALGSRSRWEAAAACTSVSSVVAVVSSLLACESPVLSGRWQRAVSACSGWRIVWWPMLPGPWRAVCLLACVNGGMLGVGLASLSTHAILDGVAPGTRAPGDPGLGEAGIESLAVSFAFQAFALAVAVNCGAWFRRPWVRRTVLAGTIAVVAGVPLFLVGIEELADSFVHSGRRGAQPGWGNLYPVSPVLAYASIWEGRWYVAASELKKADWNMFPCTMATGLPGVPVWKVFVAGYAALSALLFVLAGLRTRALRRRAVRPRSAGQGAP